jgi:hypothetical protein
MTNDLFHRLKYMKLLYLFKGIIPFYNILNNMHIFDILDIYHIFCHSNAHIQVLVGQPTKRLNI